MLQFVFGMIVGAGLMAYWYYHNKKKMDAVVKSLQGQIDKLREKFNG